MKKKNTIFYCLSGIISFIFSCILLLINEIKFNPNVFPTGFINNFNFDLLFFIKSILISIPVFICLLLIMFLFKKINLKSSKKVIPNKYIYIISFIGIFITGLIFLITYYPGSGMTDTFDILTTPIGVAHKHPLFYNLAITVPYRIFNIIFNNMNLSFFLIGILQLLIIDIVITFIIGWTHKTIKNNISTILLMTYFIFTPIITNYNTAIVKDSIFGITLLTLIPILYNIIISNGEWIKSKKNLIVTIICLTLVTLVRNNGLLVIIFILLLLFICYKKYYKNWGIILIIILVLSKSISFIPGIQESLFQEKVGVPIQQMSYVIYTDGYINIQDKEYLNNIFPIELYKEKYHPYYVDMIKWDDNFNREYLNETSSKFLKVWFNILPNNFSGYVKSYLLATYSSWAPDDFVNLQSRFLGFSDFDLSVFTDFKNIKPVKIWPNKLQNFLESFYETTTTYLNTGSCVWIMLIVGLYLIYKKNYKHLLLISPLIAIWITLMIATPLSTAFRYMVPFAYLMPFVLVIILSLDPKEKDTDK